MGNDNEKIRYLILSDEFVQYFDTLDERTKKQIR